MNAYATMRSHLTPIPTPPVVRLSSSFLGGAAVAMLSTDLSRPHQVILAFLFLLIALVLPFVHPYRHRIREYRREHQVPFQPQVWQFLPLFFLWIAIMLAPLLAPAPLWTSVLLLLAAAGWLHLTFPHIDGTRALAYALPAPNSY
ncbi:MULTISPECIES: hypothetical protein [unclassified Corynebacterium]|uniref:hypothetical protein n=1 Tax=unclassified Corynebacterium TaxID=2624378 RepID=UPI0029C9F4D0|nr:MULTISPECIES: hypothetical protein [unclassified Corynebacterium]WPF66565.1 hypothetical protein OLX12_02210 [Corynebacterium sp. 22KM0430]WPF69054.1 hypothetical protein OLW90_02205 [Corynebacterium sp. 21KM1197]